MEKFYYKYIGLKDGKTVRADFLTNRLFRFTQPNQLNDPFEANPETLMRPAPEDEERALEEMKRAGFPLDQKDRWLPLFLEPGLRRMTKKEFPGLTYPKGINSLDELDEANLRTELESLLKYVNETYGLFCMTTSPKNRTMWSIYAANHQGIVVGFDGNHPFFKNSPDFYPVEYSDQRVSLSSNDGLLRLAGEVYSSKAAARRELPARLFLRKDSSWKHEEEWRMIRELKEFTYRDPSNPEVYLFEIPRESIKVVILGAGISDENEKLIRTMAAPSNGWSGLQIVKARLRAKGFDMILSEL